MTDMTTTIDTVLALFGLYWLASGVATLVTRRIFGHGRDIAEKYTAESILAAVPFLGGANIAIGLALSVPQLGRWFLSLDFLQTYDWYILIAGAAVAVVLVTLGYKKLISK